MKHPIDDYFEKGLESLEIKPSANLFAQKIAPQIAPEKSKVGIWYRAAAIIILLLSSWFAVEYFGTSNHIPTFENQQPVATEEVISTPAVEENNRIKTKSELPVGKKVEKIMCTGKLINCTQKAKVFQSSLNSTKA